MPHEPAKPTPRSSFWFDDSKLFVSLECWSDLVGDRSLIGLAGLVAHAREVIRLNGAFIIDGGDAGILRRIDRMPEFDHLIEGVNQVRGQQTLPTL